MSSRIKDFPDGKYLKCAACGHISDSGLSELPSQNTPSEKIYIRQGSQFASMFCTNPDCHCYTIYAPASTLDSVIERYKSKKL